MARHVTRIALERHPAGGPRKGRSDKVSENVPGRPWPDVSQALGEGSSVVLIVETGHQSLFNRTARTPGASLLLSLAEQDLGGGVYKSVPKRSLWQASTHISASVHSKAMSPRKDRRGAVSLRQLLSTGALHLDCSSPNQAQPSKRKNCKACECGALCYGILYARVVVTSFWSWT